MQMLVLKACIFSEFKVIHNALDVKATLHEYVLHKLIFTPSYRTSNTIQICMVHPVYTQLAKCT